jgi:hypothetical protein
MLRIAKKKGAADEAITTGTDMGTPMMSVHAEGTLPYELCVKLYFEGV